MPWEDPTPAASSPGDGTIAGRLRRCFQHRFAKWAVVGLAVVGLILWFGRPILLLEATSPDGRFVGRQYRPSLVGTIVTFDGEFHGIGRDRFLVIDTSTGRRYVIWDEVCRWLEDCEFVHWRGWETNSRTFKLDVSMYHGAVDMGRARISYDEEDDRWVWDEFYQ